MPAQDSFKGAKIHPDNALAIQMDPFDHKQTASHGKRKKAFAYRNKQRELLKQGRLLDAIEMDKADIRSFAGDKYECAFQELDELAIKVDPNLYNPIFK